MLSQTPSGQEELTDVLDSSAILALVHDEPGGAAVAPRLSRSAVSAVNWSETMQKALAHGVDIERMRAYILHLGLRILPLTQQDAEIAAALWTSTRHLGLSFGDRACLALGLRLGLRVLTADRIWANLSIGAER